MIEMLFLRLKLQFPFATSLTNIGVLTKGFDYYLTESNTRISHSALLSAAPEEVILANGRQRKVNGFS
jgi:hypothetical protein